MLQEPSLPSKPQGCFKSFDSNLYKTMKPKLPKGGWALRVHFLSNKPTAGWRKAVEKISKIEGNVYPHPNIVFKAFHLCPWDKVRVCIVGSMPMKGDGLAFSVPASMTKGRPRLNRRFLKELKDDTGIVPPFNRGSLAHWASHNGILLLNMTLTSDDNYNGPRHYRLYHYKAWCLLTFEVLSALNRLKTEPIVFILIGKHAQRYLPCIERKYHYVIEAPAPGVLQNYNPFSGTRVFSRAAAYLRTTVHDLFGFR